jgi:hypothetical protein
VSSEQQDHTEKNDIAGPLASALFKHIQEYYHPRQREDLYEDGIEIAGFHNNDHSDVDEVKDEDGDIVRREEGQAGDCVEGGE